MSKFFNETRTVRKTDSVPATANVNIQDLVSSLKEHMESNGATASHSGQVDLEHLLQPLEAQHVLDVGCGTGDDSREIASLVGLKGRVVGIDYSAAMVAEARRRTGTYQSPA